MKAKSIFRFACSVTALAMSVPAAAQSAGASDQVGPDGSAAGEIIVTAQRRSESLQKVPLSVMVATSEALAVRNFSDPSQLPLLVPSLQLTSFLAAPGATNFSIRGIGTASFSHLVEPTVATVIDGIVMSRPEMGVAEFSDVARIEVLNGPQGMLFGKNASAGLVNIVTNRPKIGSLEGFTNLSYENIEAAQDAGYYKANSTLNVPLTDTSAARLTGFYSKHDSLIGNSLPGGFDDFGREQFGVRAKLLVDPGEGLSVYLSGDYTKSDGMGTGAYTPRSEGPALAGLHADAGVVPSPRNLFNSVDAPTDLHYQIAGAQAEIGYAFDSGVTLTNIVGYRSYLSNHTIDLDLLQIDLLNTVAARQRFEQFTEELRVASPSGGAFEYQAGLFYYSGFDRRVDRIRGEIGMSDAPPDSSSTWLGLNAQDDLYTKSYAAYAQGTYRLTDKFSLTVGGRVTHDDLRFVGRHDNDDIFITIAGDGPGPHIYRESQSKTDFSWRVSAQYAFTPAINAYVTVARGYKGPGYNLSWAGSPGGAAVGAETSMDYEAGIKSRLFDKLLLNISAYWEEFSDFQVQSFKASGVPGVGSFIIQNAGKLRARGFEGNFSLDITPNLTFSGAGAHNDAIYLKFPGAPCYVGQTAAQGCVDGAVDASGHRLVNAPKWSGNLALDYRQPLAGGWTVRAHGDVFAQSAINFSPNNDPNTIQPRYAIVNASLALSGADDAWTLRAFCRNCFDKRFVTSIGGTVVGGAGDYGQSFAIDSFRSIGLALNLRY
jgi:iron complex outermembrane receptor protein